MRSGFGLVEAIVALVVFAVGALGAAALTAHAARWTTRAGRAEAALLRMEMLLDSLAQAPDPVSGSQDGAVARYEWTVAEDSTGRRIEVRARAGGPDTLAITAYRPGAPPLLLAW